MRKLSCVPTFFVALFVPKVAYGQQPIRVHCGGPAHRDFARAPQSPELILNFSYPDGTAVLGTLNYSVSSSLLSFQGSERLTNGQAHCVLFPSPDSMGISAQFQVNLSLIDSSGHALWQINTQANPAQVNLSTLQSSTINVVVEKL